MILVIAQCTNLIKHKNVCIYNLPKWLMQIISQYSWKNSYALLLKILQKWCTFSVHIRKHLMSFYVITATVKFHLKLYHFNYFSTLIDKCIKGRNFETIQIYRFYCTFIHYFSNPWLFLPMKIITMPIVIFLFPPLHLHLFVWSLLYRRAVSFLISLFIYLFTSVGTHEYLFYFLDFI